MTAPDLHAWVDQAFDRCLALTADLSDQQLMGPRLEVINPLRWELGHVAWFLERWLLRQTLGQTPSRADGDSLYDSIAIAHALRWDLPLPDRAGTLAYVEQVRARTHQALEAPTLDPDVIYHTRYGVLHADMHAEAFTCTRQTLAYPAPPGGCGERPLEAASGDTAFEACAHRLGAEPRDGFCFDNEKWAHPVEVPAFQLAARPVSEGDLLAFVRDRGYSRRDLWDDAGWAWRLACGAELPHAWRAAGDAFEVRRFDRWRATSSSLAARHVSWHEAQAWCRWAGRRLPSEPEWERAQQTGELGDVGHVWEWTETTFRPFPGFVPDPYREYSQPWFETRKVLRGGCWATSSRLTRPGYRNFLEPHRRDGFTGFRTCPAS